MALQHSCIKIQYRIDAAEKRKLLMQKREELTKVAKSLRRWERKIGT
jgi:hypothetical protein